VSVGTETILDSGPEPTPAPGSSIAESRGPGISRDGEAAQDPRRKFSLGAVTRVLFLDDDPKRAARFLAACPNAYWVQTADECIARLAEIWDEVHLDHDLGGEIFVDSNRTDCGMEVVRWLCDMGHRSHLKHADFFVHTHNLNAAGQMLKALRSAGYSVVYRPFGMDLLQWLQEAEAEVGIPSPELTAASGPWTPSWLAWIRRLRARFVKRAAVVRRQH